MHTTRILAVAAYLTTLTAASAPAGAQQVQIPTLQVCNQTAVSGVAQVRIDNRVDAAHSGKFDVRIDMKCDPATGYPTGTLTIGNISMSDTSSLVSGGIQATTFEQVTTTGKHTPTVYLNGRCKGGQIVGCRYWLMIADNKRAGAPPAATPDIIGFLIFDSTGHRVAYGTGPVVTGDLTVASTSW